MINAIELKKNRNSKEERVGQASSRKQIHSLTGTRAFLAAIVITCHFKEHFPCMTDLSNSFAYDHALVGFFVLSGFILTYNYFDLKGFKDTCRFYVARFARVWPAHFLSLMLLIFLVPEVFKVQSKLLPVFLCNLSLVQAWIPSWRTYFSFNAPSWSISTELFFYLCFPLLLLGLQKRWYIPVLVTGASLLAVIGLSGVLHLPECDVEKLSIQGLVYINPLSRIIEFAIGMVAALAYKNWSSKTNFNTALATTAELLAVITLGFLAVNGSAWRYACLPFTGDAFAFWVQNCNIVPIAYAFLFFSLAQEKGLLSKFLGLPLIVLLGEISFAAYLLHGVLITYCAMNFPNYNSPQVLMAIIPILILSSHIMYMLMETPLRKGIIGIGNSLIAGKASFGKAKAKSFPISMATIAVLEIAALTSLIYFNLPSIQKITNWEAHDLANVASVHNISYAPYLECRSAVANAADKNIAIKLVWESLKEEPVDFYVKIQILDNKDNVVGQIGYLQDGRCEQVAAGQNWVDDILVPVAKQNEASKAVITVLKHKKQILCPNTNSNTETPQTSFVIPVT